MFDVSGPSTPTSATATSEASAGRFGADAQTENVTGSVESAEPEPRVARRGTVPQSSSNEPAPDAGEILGAPEATLPQVSQAVVASEVAPVTAHAQQGESISAAPPLSERRIEDRRQSSGQTTDAVPPTGNTGNAIARQPAVVSTGAEPPPPPPAPPPAPPPPIEVPTPLTPMTVGRAPVDLAASAAMAKDILAANEEQPQLQSRRDARPTTPADGSAASTPDLPGAERSGGRAGEDLGSEAAGDDAPATPDFFASTRAKKRFRR